MAAALTLPLATLVLLGDAAILITGLLFLAGMLSRRIKQRTGLAFSTLSGNAILIALVVALVSTLGSLYFSEIAGYEPCKLCWYQRILMYPMVLLFAIALFKKDSKVFSYAIPMSALGAVIAAYHYSLQVSAAGAAATCSATGGTSCASAPFFSYGYITIPFMALTGFVMIMILGFLAKKH